MEGLYCYRPLEDDSRSIRVLVLQPARSLTDPLVCSLEEFRLDGSSYTALSYSWAMEDDKLVPDIYGHTVNNWLYRTTYDQGDSSPTKPLFLDSIEVLVGENLRDAFRRLREPIQEPSRLWVDALCINQQNEVEKSGQVGIMSTIYDNAERIVAWLGEGEKRANAAANIAFRCLIFALQNPQAHVEHNWLRPPWEVWDWWNRPRQLWNHRRRRETCAVCRDFGIVSAALPHSSRFQALFRTWYRICTVGLRDITVVEALYAAMRRWRIPGAELREVPPFTALLTLSQRRYLTRLWVLQEAAVQSADRVTFQWGGYSLPGSPINLFDEFALFGRAGGVARTLEKGPPPKNTVHCKDLISEWQMVDWVSYSSNKHCYDPRDRIYAILGCMSQPHIRPDYSLSLPEVLKIFAKEALLQRSIETLLFNFSGNRYSRGVSGLPTWMPDLTQPFYGFANKEPKEKAWQYVKPVLSTSGEVLSCYLAYLGEIQFPRSKPYHFKYNIIWQAQQKDHGEWCEQFPYADRDVEQVKSGLHTASLIELSGLQTGDVICSVPTSRAREQVRLILRSKTDSGLWEIVRSWHDYDLKYKTALKPQQRRLYQLI